MQQRLSGLVCVVSALVMGAACSGGGSPTAPTPAPTAITISSSGTHLFLGVNETFTASVTLSNGTTQALTGGTWGTDANAVATVTSAGVVSGVGAGEVTVFVDAQGLRGTKRITVVPNYQGIWNGSYTMTSCAQSGQMATIDLCGTYPVGTALPLSVNLNQTASTVTGQTALGGLISAQFTTVAAANGSLTFPAIYTLGTLQVAQAWQLNLSALNQMSGSVVQTWTDPTLSGQILLTGTLNPMVKGAAPMQHFSSPGGLGSLTAVRNAFGGRR